MKKKLVRKVKFDNEAVKTIIGLGINNSKDDKKVCECGTSGSSSCNCPEIMNRSTCECGTSGSKS